MSIPAGARVARAGESPRTRPRPAGHHLRQGAIHMRKPLVPLLVAALLLLGGLSAWLLVQRQESKLAYQDLSAAEEQSRQNYDRTLDAIAEIQDSLDVITPRDTTFQVVPGSLDTEQQMAGPDGRRALERIAALRASIERSRARIQQLEASLKSEGARVGSMRRMVANLNRTLAERQRTLDEMVSRVEALQGRVGTLETEVKQKEETIVARDASLEERRRELATVYCLVGTREELTKQGAIVATGGVLGLGKTLLPAGKTSVGVPLDTDQTSVVHTNAPKARVLTAQPVSSYELRLVDGKMELHILDAAEFRKIRQLVIVTT